jgi:predicted RNase H-like nuclease (RuvC/YqgF family)
VLGPTIAADAAKLEAEKAKAEKQAEADKEAALRSGPAEDSEARLKRMSDQNAQLEIQRQRFAEEIRQLRAELDQRQQRLDQRQADLEAREKSVSESRIAAEQQTESEDFKRAVGALEGQRPKDAATVLKQVLGAGPTDALNATTPEQAQKQRDLVVDYLAAMQERTRNKILAEFIKEDQRLASELLEAMRTRGLSRAAASP